MARRLRARSPELLDFIVEHVERHGFPPTWKEMARAMGYASPSSLAPIIANLVLAGYISREPRKARGIKILIERTQ